MKAGGQVVSSIARGLLSDNSSIPQQNLVTPCMLEGTKSTILVIISRVRYLELAILGEEDIIFRERALLCFFHLFQFMRGDGGW
jgi:hypothetical protein